MCGIAEALYNYGFEVTGSDLQKSEVTGHLEEIGIKVCIGHNKANVKDADILVYSSAVPNDNPEIMEAWRKGIPFIKRAEMLGELMRTKWGIAITGTHGKTTTTSIMGNILHQAKFDPTIIVGGKVKTLDSTIKLGESDFMVVEADEFDRSFLKIIPTGIIITSIEPEHLDCYTDLEDIKNTYAQFANKVPFYGFVVLCTDSDAVKETIPLINKKIILYGIETEPDYSGKPEYFAKNIVYKGNVTEYDAYEFGKKLGRIKLNLPGKHNVLNSLGALAFARTMEINFDRIKTALENFKGVFRRFEIKKTVNDILVVDDYAHHPSEIAACLDAAKSGWNRRIIAIFQPHLFSRTRDFAKDFGKALSIADFLIVADIYPAREEPIPGVTGKLICDYADKYKSGNIFFFHSREEIVKNAVNFAKPGDMIITIGAGDVWKINDLIVEELEK